MERKRLTAIKTKINPIISGRFVRQEGFNPNYILTSTGMRLSRIVVLATIVDKFISDTGKFASITMDDGSGTIRAKAFNTVSIFDSLEVGDIIDFVGRVKEYKGEVFLMPEIIRKIDDPNIELLRELDIKKQETKLNSRKELVLNYQKQTSDMEELKKIMSEKFNIQNEELESILQSQEMEEETKEDDNESKEKIMKFIVECDRGDGCDYSELLEKSGLAEDVIDNIINDLLTEGICFEPRPGKIKKL